MKNWGKVIPTYREEIISIEPGVTEYRRGGVYHRLDGPAIEDYVWMHQWYVEGYRIYNYKDFQETTFCSDADILMLRLRFGEIIDEHKMDTRWR